MKKRKVAPRGVRFMKKHFWFLVAIISLLICDACSSGTGATNSTQGMGTSAATHFSITARASSTVGKVFNFTVTALDASNNVATKYSGTVQVTSSDFQAVLSPPSSTLTNGTGTFSATMNTAGAQTISATDTVAASITGISASIDVSAATFPHFSITAPTNVTAGTSFNFTVTALDGSDVLLPDYAGTVVFSSSDSQASLPANSTLTNGTGTFSATLKTAGNAILNATDTVTVSMAGSGTMNVSPAAWTHLSVTSPSYANSATPFQLTVTVLDAWNNQATGYTGTVHLTSSDSQAVLPPDSAVANGGANFSLTLNTDGVQTVTATDTATSTAGTSGSITVLPPGQLAITSGQPPNGTVGQIYGKANSVCDSPPDSIDGFELEAAGGTIGRRNLTFSGTSLPPGLQVTSITLVVSPQCYGTLWFIEGTPTTAGTFTFSVTASESTYSGTATYTITIAGASASVTGKQEKAILSAGQSRAAKKDAEENDNQ